MIVVVCMCLLVAVQCQIKIPQKAGVDRATGKNVIYAGNDANLQKTPSPAPDVNRVADHMRRRVADIIDRIRHDGDDEKARRALERLMDDQEDVCKDLFSGNDEKKCKDLIESKGERGRDRAKKIGNRIDDEVELDEQVDKFLAKQRRKDAKPILKDLEQRLKPFSGKKSLKGVKGDSARLSLEKVLWMRQDAIDRCKLELLRGNSPECAGQVESMTRDIIEELRSKRHDK